MIPRLPREIICLILDHRRRICWAQRKRRLHKILDKAIIPYESHSTAFQFREFSVTYYRTENIEICITERHPRMVTLQHTLNVQCRNEPGYVNVVRLRFVYCPTYLLK